MCTPSVNAIWVRAGRSCAGSAAAATIALSTLAPPDSARQRPGARTLPGGSPPNPWDRRPPGRQQTHVRYRGVVRELQGTLLGAEGPTIDPSVAFKRVALDDTSWVDLARGWLRGADTLLDVLVRTVPWRQGRRHLYGRMVDDPRLSRWYGPDDELPHPALAQIRTVLSARYHVPFAAVGLNYYRDGRDSVASHRDRELRDVDDTLVPIVTLGAARPFLIRAH